MDSINKGDLSERVLEEIP